MYFKAISNHISAAMVLAQDFVSQGLGYYAKYASALPEELGGGYTGCTIERLADGSRSPVFAGSHDRGWNEASAPFGLSPESDLRGYAIEWIACSGNRVRLEFHDDHVIVEIKSRRHGIPCFSGPGAWASVLPNGLEGVSILEYRTDERNWHPLDTADTVAARNSG